MEKNMVLKGEKRGLYAIDITCTCEDVYVWHFRSCKYLASEFLEMA